ncbi:uncharacterized protein LOC105421451 [Amborella trichopoda]|uniref:uncharacterized protein LOC105421451 n=1 Tax=Amborella trichopoda TaxID=13333 RepID=UPI0005D35C86|nr:uncharacterized protein LOC105421451 [Amborella trichopoda]|eukprot:XP_011627192.1 uncharacterized protein LOC105421451 [Amborella trichopoda]
MVNQEANISDYYVRRGGHIVWNINLPYNRITDLLFSQLSNLLKLLEDVCIPQNVVDEVVWELDKNEIYSLKSMYNLLFHDRVRWSMHVLARSWKWPLPLKIQGFLWLAPQDKVLTIDNLIKRGKILPNNWLLCKEDGESGDHFFLQCPFANKIWRWFFEKLGVALVMPLSVVRSFPLLFQRLRLLRGKFQEESSFGKSGKREVGEFLKEFHYLLEKLKDKWMTPPPGVYKLNFDRSSIGNPGASGFGGVIGDWARNVALSYAGPFGVRTAKYAELFALLFGLRVIWR